MFVAYRFLDNFFGSLLHIQTFILERKKHDCWYDAGVKEKGFADSFHASGVVDSCERSGGGLLLRCSSTKKKLCSAYTYEFVVQLVVEENRLTKFVVRFVIKPQTNETWLAI